MSRVCSSFLLCVIAVLVVLLAVPVSGVASGAGSFGCSCAADWVLTSTGCVGLDHRLSSDEAVALVVNDWGTTTDGYRLRHPQHVADLTTAGVRFVPRHGGPEWAWRLTTVTVGRKPLSGVDTGAVSPLQGCGTTVAYLRGRIIEQYVTREATLEQQFIVTRPLPLDGADLTIVGTVWSEGTFETVADGWWWRGAGGAVHLGDVRAYDAIGRQVPARMEVTADETRIVVDGEALARAAYPVTIDPEIGANDFRLSDMGPNTYVRYLARFPAVAYNSTDDEYLVVWEGDDDTGLLVDDEFEIYGQRVDAATGAEVGENDFRLSDMGPDGDPSYDAQLPAVAYNSVNNEYLVVWQGNDGPPLESVETEIYGQRLDAATGAEVGQNDFRLSDMGPDGNFIYSAFAPAVAYNSTDNEYLVVWEGHDQSSPDQGYEIYAQRLNAATADEVGANDFRLSDMGPADNPDEYHANWPAVAYNSWQNQYLVVWQGEDAVPPLVDGEWEIYGQRVDAAGNEIGTDDFRLSQMGPAGDPDYDAYRPAVAYNSTDSAYLVVWMGCDSTMGLPCGASEIYGQRVAGPIYVQLGDDFALSDMGPPESDLYNAHDPGVAYDPAGNEYLVVWWGNDDLPPSFYGETEIYGQRVNAATGSQVGQNDFRLSDMGQDGDTYCDAADPAVACRSGSGQCLVVWQGDDDIPPLRSGEYEIFGQRFALSGGQYRLYLPLMLRVSQAASQSTGAQR